MFCIVLCNADLACLCMYGVVVDWIIDCGIGHMWIVIICSFGYFG